MVGLLVSAMLVLGGCGVPVDPGGTLERIDAGILRAGASASGGLVVVSTPAAGQPVDVTGPLADLVEGFAETRGARVVWTSGSEEELVDGLEDGSLDLAIGGMTDATPWADRASVTRGYSDIPGADGRSIVLLLPLGENGTQSALERYLDEELG